MRRPSLSKRVMRGLALMAEKAEPMVKPHSAESLFTAPFPEREDIRKGIKYVRQLAEWQAGRKR